MHVICAEYLGIGQLNYMDRIWIEHRPSVLPQFNYFLESPETYALLVWMAVGKGVAGVSGSEGRDFWCKDDGRAIYLSRQGFDYTGQWSGFRAEVTADVRNRPLNMVLAFTNVLKEQVLKLKLNAGDPANVHSLVRKDEGIREAREGVGESEGEKGAIDEIKEEANSIFSSAFSH